MNPSAAVLVLAVSLAFGTSYLCQLDGLMLPGTTPVDTMSTGAMLAGSTTVVGHAIYVSPTAQASLPLVSYCHRNPNFTSASGSLH